MKERRIVHCPHCQDTFSYLIQTQPEALNQNLLARLSCPFCKTKLKIALSAANRRMVEIYRETQAGFKLDLPDELNAQIDV